MEVKKSSLLGFILTLLVTFTTEMVQIGATSYKNYFGIEMNNEEYNNLINLGFSTDEIYYMDEQTFEENKNISATLVSQNEKYYKSVYTDLNGETYSVEITKEEYDNQGSLNTRGTVSTEYKTMISTMSQSSDSFRYKVSLSWKNMPSVRSYDIIGVGFADDVYINSSVYFHYYWCNSSGECVTATDYYNKKKTTTGGSAVFKFPSSAKSLSATVYYDVAKDTTSTITELNMCGDYSHATTSVNSSIYSNYNITINGIVLTSSISYYDAIPCALSTWYGSW